MVTPHEYYLLVMVPFASVIAGRGAYWVEEKIQAEFLVRSSHVLSAAISLMSVVCSVLIFSINFVAAQDMERRSANIEKEMHNLNLSPNYLSKTDVNKVTNMESEKFRKSLVK